MDLDIEIKDYKGTKCLKILILKCFDLNIGICARILSNLIQMMGFWFGDEKTNLIEKNKK